MEGKPYEPWEDQLIVARYKLDSHRELAKVLSRTISALRSRAGLLGVRAKGIPDWTLEEDRILKKHHPDIGKVLRLLKRRSRGAIKTRVVFLKLGLRKRWQPEEDELVRKLTPFHSDAEIGKILGRSDKAVTGRRGTLRVARFVIKPASVPVIADLLAEAQLRGVKLKTLCRVLGCDPVRRSQTRSIMSISSVARVVEVFGGELYAEWDD